MDGFQSRFGRCGIEKTPFPMPEIEPLFLGHPVRGLVLARFTVLKRILNLRIIKYDRRA
jgi:hypothetical protein